MAKQITLKEKTKVWMQVLLTLVTISIAIFMLLQNDDVEGKKWAAGWIGVVLGYWFS